MKIAFFFDEPNYFGGAGSLLLKQAKLMARIHEVLVVVPINEEGKENFKCVAWCEKSNLQHVGMKYKTSYNFRNVDFLDALKRVDSICQLIKDEKIDFLHSAQINVAVELASRKMNIPHLMNIYQLRREEFLFAQEDIYAHYHLCDSEMYSKIWREQLNVVSECMRPLSPLQYKLKEDIVAKNTYTILVLGLLCERKNQLAAIQAIEKLEGKLELQLIIAGDYNNLYGNECVDYVNSHDLPNKVKFVGFMTDVESLFLHSDWFLLVSTDESFPSSIVEAVSYNLPIITTPVAGVPEIFRNQFNAFVSYDYSVESIAQAIEECYDSCQNSHIADIQNNVTKTWDKYFSLEKNLKRMDDYYTRIIVENKESPRKCVDKKLIQEVEQTKIQIVSKCNNAPNLIQKSFYYNYLLKELQSKKDRKAYIWGAGMLGYLAYDFLTNLIPDIEVVNFIDSYKEGMYQGVSIERYENIVWDKECCLVFIAFAGDIWTSVERLKKDGLIFGENIWILP